MTRYTAKNRDKRDNQKLYIEGPTIQWPREKKKNPLNTIQKKRLSNVNPSKILE
jgi:hypothetical protein